jgi:hypothetical protein
MTVVVPDPIPLEMPPGDPAALEDFVEDVAGTAYRLAVVRTCLTSSAATAPNWRGADASAATAQVGVVAALAEELSGGVAAAAHRLRAHHDLLTSTRQRVTVLRSQQDEDFLIARARLREIPDFLTAVPPEAAAVAEELAAAEEARRREHDRLLAEVADDASATSRALAEASAIVGGTGRSGDDGLVIAHLAAELPGWGNPELRRRGEELAEAMSGLLPPAERESLARDAVAFAGSAAFAGAFLAGVGERGVGEMLALLGDGDLGPDSALARTLAFALGAAIPAGTGGGAVGAVLTARYIDPDEPGSEPDLIALGMGAVLRTGGSAGPRSETVVTWARQVLDRERSQANGLIAARAIDRAYPLHESRVAEDPMELVVEALVRNEDPGAAASLLRDRQSWDVLLSRSWGGDPAPLRSLVAHAAAADGAAGEVAVRSGLEALGAGLADGDPEDWTVDPGTALALAPTLGGAVARHVDVAVDALSRGVDGRLGTTDGDVLRGLGYLTLDEEATRAIDGALHEWALLQPVALAGHSPSSPLPAVAVPAAFVATREYGQRLAYALHGFEQQQAAERRSDVWDATIGLASNFVRRAGPGIAVGLTVDYAAILFDFDGTWDNGRDEGRFFDGTDAAAAVLAECGAGDERDLHATAAQARATYARTLEALGLPKPPESPQTDWAAPLRKAVADAGLNQVSDVAKRALRGSPEHHSN